MAKDAAIKKHLRVAAGAENTQFYGCGPLVGPRIVDYQRVRVGQFFSGPEEDGRVVQGRIAAQKLAEHGGPRDGEAVRVRMLGGFGVGVGTRSVTEELRRLSVFVGGWTLEAAEPVAAGPSPSGLGRGPQEW